MENKQIKIGANPLCWMNSDIPGLGSHIPVEQCLIDCHRIGYAGIELEDPFKRIIDRFPSLLKEYHLELVAGWHSTFILADHDMRKEMESLKRHMDQLHQLGGHVVNLAECSFATHREPRSLSQRPQLKEVQWLQLCESIDQLAEYLHDQGFISAYHHHMGTVVQSGADIDRLMAGTRHLGLLFDTGHLSYAGDNPLSVLKKHVNRVTHVHCKNVRSEVLKQMITKDSDFFTAILDGTFTVPGDGEGVDFCPIVQKLVDDGYSGWLIMEAEQDPKKADPYTYAKLGYDTLKKILEKANCHINTDHEKVLL